VDSDKLTKALLLLLAVLGISYGIRQAANDLTWVPCSSCRKR